MLNINTGENGFNEIGSHKENEIKDDDLKKILIKLINEIITGTFISKENIKDEYSIITTHYFDFKQYYTYNQNKGSLCGFHSLFNIYYFLHYLISLKHDANTNNFNNYLFNLKNAWSFWSFYKESINYLLINLPLENKPRESLLKGGPLERYQFVYLLKEFPKIKKLFHDMKDNYIISFTKFLYGFGIFNGTMDEAIDFQEKMNHFLSDNNKDKEKILIILLGIVNHWNILILNKNIENKINIYFLDSRNSPEIFDSFEFFDNIKEENKTKMKEIKDKYIKKEIDKKNKNVSNWYITCLKEWYDSMNQSIIIIFKILKKELNLVNYIIDSKIKLLINSFINKTNLDLNNLKDEINIDNYNNKIEEWIKEEYHPAYFKENILNDLKKNKIEYIDKSFKNWIIIMEMFIEKEKKKFENDEENIIIRYLKAMNELKLIIDFDKDK